jgi:hypothetical protein
MSREYVVHVSRVDGPCHVRRLSMPRGEFLHDTWLVGPGNMCTKSMSREWMFHVTWIGDFATWVDGPCHVGR